MNLIYDVYPETVILDGAEREIVTDFKDWLRFMDMLRDETLRPEEKVRIMMSFYLDDIPETQWVGAYAPLLRFFRMDGMEDTPEPERPVGETVQARPLYDFVFDAKYIISGFWQDYGIDLTETDMHWWKFRILLDGLSADTEFKQRVMYRNTDATDIKDVKERQRIQRIQRAIAIPHPVPTDGEIGGMFW